jgi:hypothetical protein
LPYQRIEAPDRPYRQSATSEIMDEYKASVQGVDNALARLNATLASYKISGNLPKKPAADLVTKSGNASASSINGTHADPEGAVGSLKHHIFQVVSKVASEPVDWETWTSMSDAEALQKYPEVRVITYSDQTIEYQLTHMFCPDSQR